MKTIHVRSFPIAFYSLLTVYIMSILPFHSLRIRTVLPSALSIGMQISQIFHFIWFHLIKIDVVLIKFRRKSIICNGIHLILFKISSSDLELCASVFDFIKDVPFNIEICQRFSLHIFETFRWEFGMSVEGKMSNCRVDNADARPNGMWFDKLKSVTRN